MKKSWLKIRVIYEGRKLIFRLIDWLGEWENTLSNFVQNFSFLKSIFFRTSLNPIKLYVSVYLPRGLKLDSVEHNKALFPDSLNLSQIHLML